MERKVMKQVLGVDVARQELVVTLGRMFEDLSTDLYASRVFRNSDPGVASLVEWVRRRTDETVAVRYVMEATGVYHQRLAYHLDSNGHGVSIILPNKISNYMRTLENKTVTDRSCSEAIARFGLERKLDPWHRPDKLYRNLQQLTRERDQVVAERVAVKNQLHAERSEAEPNENSLRRMEARSRFLSEQEAEIKREICAIMAADSALDGEVRNLCSIPGVGMLTVAVVLGETNGFELVRNRKQLASYAGFDVKEKQSGTSVRGKPRISKKGNRNLRKAMHLPALSAVKWDPNFRALYTRLVAKHGVKMKALVAVQRKLLELIYVLYKNSAAYDEQYGKSRVQIPTA